MVPTSVCAAPGPGTLASAEGPGPPTSTSALTAPDGPLLGVHSSRMDMGNRDLVLDESLGLNCAWYANILLTLTEARA